MFPIQSSKVPKMTWKQNCGNQCVYFYWFTTATPALCSRCVEGNFLCCVYVMLCLIAAVDVGVSCNEICIVSMIALYFYTFYTSCQPFWLLITYLDHWWCFQGLLSVCNPAAILEQVEELMNTGELAGIPSQVGC